MNNKFMFLVLGILLISFTSAWSSSTFNNSLSTENITFSGNENYTRWLSVPENTIVTNGYLNLSGVLDIYISERNSAYSCISSGSCNNAFDGDWETYAESADSPFSIYENFTINGIESYLNYTIKIKTWDFIFETRCWNGSDWIKQYEESFQNVGIHNINLSLLCYQNKSKLQVWNYAVRAGGSETIKFYESNISYIGSIYNSSILINNTQIWNQTGELNSTNSPQKTNNFATTINNYIKTATAVAGYYKIPFIFHSDTAGILQYSGLSFNNSGIIENSQTYPSSAIETSIKTYTANLTYDNNFYNIISGSLYLNGSTYTGTRTGSGTSAIFTTSATMPSIATITNFTAYWTISLTNINGTTNYNLTSHNVTVTPINFSLCDATTNIPFWNFTILNESNAAIINSTFEGTFTLKLTGSSVDNIFSYADTTGTKSQFNFCISPGTESYTINTNIKLTKDGYVDKFYNYGSVVVTNATREDNLYMMITGDSTSFIVHTVYASGEDLINAEVKVQRYYPGTNQWLTTEILTTNDEGEAIGHFLSEDADYRFQVYLVGVSIYNSSSTKIVCATAPCTVTLIIPSSFLTGYETHENLDTTLTYNPTTNTFTYTYSDTGTTFDSARLWVTRISPSNATIVSPCNESKLTASGVITCDITGQVNGTYRAVGYITRDDSEFVSKIIYGSIGTNFYSNIGEDGILWGFFLLIAITMLGIARPSMAIVFGILSLIFVSLLGIVNIGIVSIVAVISIGIILLMRVGRE